MHIVHVSIKVKNQFVDAFREASLENAKNSSKEEGVVRFDVLQQQGNSQMFLLCEVYHTLEDQLKHRETSHFKIWKETITDMLVEPYTFTKYKDIYTDDSGRNYENCK